MSNTIVAIARDTQYSASSYNGADFGIHSIQKSVEVTNGATLPDDETVWIDDYHSKTTKNFTGNVVLTTHNTVYPSMLPRQRWRSIHGNETNYLYSVIDDDDLFSFQAISTSNGSDWNASVLPTSPIPCITFIANGHDVVYTSFDGETVKPNTLPEVNDLVPVTTIPPSVLLPDPQLKYLESTGVSATVSKVNKNVQFVRTIESITNSLSSLLSKFKW